MSEDLLNMMGAKPTQTETMTTESKTQGIGGNPTPRGTNLLGDQPEVKAEPTPSKEAESTAKTTETKPADEFDPNKWDKESMYKEIRKLREENKQTRLRYQDISTKLQSEAEERIRQKEEEMAAALEAKKELETLKAKEEDKKRNLDEKLAHREARIAELELLKQQEVEAREAQIQEMQTKLSELEAYQQAQMAVHQKKLQEELDSVPEKYREFANTMVRGVSDPREALLLLGEARLSGLFDEKAVHVNHSVPGANDGARATSEKLNAAAKEARSRMSSDQLIKEGLKSWRSGVPNSAFPHK